MREGYLLTSPRAKALYETARECPIYDYHCHLSPREIYEDKPFTNIGEMWLSGDHYKWRLMRGADIPEERITGTDDYHDRFIAYAEALNRAAGNPLAVWSHMELAACFNLPKTLTPKTAERFWNQANEVIRAERLSPRKLIEKFNVRFIGTTDDPCDTLEYHELLAADESFTTEVIPTFRTDNLLNLRREGYAEYLARLEQCAGIKIRSVADLLDATERRIRFFRDRGCVLSDVGIATFPDHVGSEEEANEALQATLRGEEITDTAFHGFLGYLFVALGKLYRKHRMIMQLHLGAYRNPNSTLFASLGADCGCDCIGEAVKGAHLIAVLDAIDRDGGLPETILYTLNPAMNDCLASIAGSFRGVRLGAAWWFNDHKDGIVKVLNSVSSIGVLGSFYGMLTDSRSFLSYTRHDYFRRILCSYLADLWETGELIAIDSMEELLKDICYRNIERKIGELK